MKHPSKHLSYQKTSSQIHPRIPPPAARRWTQKKCARPRSGSETSFSAHPARTPQIKTRTTNRRRWAIARPQGMFLNISLKKFYQTLSELCTDSVSPPGAKHYKENYEKIYSYIQSVVPDADSMTICSFLRYIDDAYMYPRGYKGESEEEYKERIRQGNRLSELFFLYSFSPLLRRRGLHYEAVTFRLTSTYVNRQTKRKE